MIAPFNAGSIGTKYRWLGSGPYLSNMYYKLLAHGPTYYWQNGFGMNPTDQANNPNYTNFRPFAVGDAEGNPVSTWGFRVGCSNCWNTAQTTMGGPCVWRPTSPSAEDCPNREQLSDDLLPAYIRPKLSSTSMMSIVSSIPPLISSSILLSSRWISSPIPPPIIIVI